jgi:anti-sigma factor RsiW
MNCRKVRELIEVCAFGEAATAEREIVEAHAAACPACARELALSRQLAGALGSLPARPVSEAFDRNLEAALAARRPEPSPTAWWERLRLRCEWRLRFPAMVTAGSMAMACVAGLVTLRVQDGMLARQAVQEQRREFVSTAVQRYEQLQRADPNVNWDAVDASIQLNTGSVITE